MFRDNISVPSSRDTQSKKASLLDPWRWDRFFFPKRRRRTTDFRCVTSQTKEDLIYTVAKAWNCVASYPKRRWSWYKWNILHFIKEQKKHRRPQTELAYCDTNWAQLWKQLNWSVGSSVRPTGATIRWAKTDSTNLMKYFEYTESSNEI